MRKFPPLFLCILLILFPCFSAWAVDFGLILDQSGGVGGTASDNQFDYSGLLIPRFSSLVGGNGSLYISAGIRADYQDEDFSLTPELLRTEFLWNADSWELTAGRMHYSDPLGFIAEGLFDGARFSYDTKVGTFSAGAWYTGLLYKNRANISMNYEEENSRAVEVDYSDFVDTYFAPKRVVAALDWEHPSLAGLFSLNAAILGQIDLTDADMHSQYLAAKISVPVANFVFDLGGCLELMEFQGIDESTAESSNEIGIALAAELGIAWMLPTSIEDRLSLLGRFSSGTAEEGSVYSFLPVTTQSQGGILKAKLSGLSVISLDYIARIHRSFSMSLSSSYFIRSDKGTYYGYPAGAADSDGYFLGNEFFGRLLWSPVSDIQLNLGGGAFLPSMGNAAPDADALWRVELNIIMSLY